MSRILVVDDMEDNIKALSFDLLDDGYEVSTALSGHQALLELQSNPPDLILLDLLMPEMDGFEVCRRMQENPQRREIPIIVVSALDDHDSIVRALDMGAQDYVTKPYYYPIIAARVRAALRQKKERDLLLQLNADLDTARTMAEAGMRAKSSFRTNMSHEVRTPINGITGMAQLLRGSNLTVEQKDYVDTIEMVSDNLLNMIDEILDYSKIEAGEVFIEHKRFHLRDCIDDAIASVSDLSRQKQLAIQIQIQPELATSYLGDRGRVRQILHHLLHNAVKFTRSGKVELTVCASHHAAKDDNHCQLQFTIRDTGIGFDPAHLRTLLGSFSQADESTQRRYGGTGLGLAICYQLVDHMDGDIQLNSKPQQGTRVDVHLPFEKDRSGSPIAPGWHGLEQHRVAVISNCPDQEPLIKQCLEVLLCDVQIHQLPLPSVEELNSRLNGRENPELVILNVTTEQLAAYQALVDDTGKLSSCPRFVIEPVEGFTEQAEADDPLRQCRVLRQPMQFGQWYQQLHQAVATVSSEEGRIQKPHLPILLAEDNLVNQKVAQKILDNLGYQVDTVCNGLDALDAIKHKDYGLVLMDCQMPEMDGYEATREIRKLQGLERHLPIIALTAHAMRGDRERCLEAGMDDYLTKPIKIPQLKDTLEHWFRTLTD